MKPNNISIEERSDAIRQYLFKAQRFCSKEELGDHIGCSERIVRDCINHLRNKGFMVVSVSSQKGYRLLTHKDMSEQDAELVKQMWCEIDNRIKELESMKKVCAKYWNYREKKIWNEHKEKANNDNR